MREKQKQYTAEFRADALALLRRRDRSIHQLAVDLGVNHWTLRSWYREDAMKRAKNKTPAAAPPPAKETPAEKIERLERELARLKKHNEQLEMDREILKKAAAFFAKESE